ncbi:SDR family oxidoreductase [Neobacillus sp. MM2021_6]|uniref:SDR family NAD(P)-dependent oxidoreductase n=1 Tax=Bacillaceae TaxID=186817 RepID=UPI00140B21FD|nr:MULTISPECIES: SDR family oxidoreductase [Bacillaceae]MBO0960005.1 SDR family oxidoreductase [Neobacillus sp. MM2021_6]NHC18673.1 SDR family oxidoreductase [Bacillus sp. MM2020_4]
MTILNGKTAIVTGAGSGMGKAIAQTFAHEGANVTFADLHVQSAITAASDTGVNHVQAIQADVTNDSDVANLVNQTVEVYNGLDIVINCAGVPQSFTSIEELTVEQWDVIMNVNTKSIFLTSKYAVPIMKQQKSGSIVTIASIAGIRARPGLNAYCASKGAAIMLTKALALELAPYQIRVNAINPGPADTPMIGKFLVGNEDQKEEGMKKIFQDSVPLGKLIQPEDIAKGALYLASDLAKMVTGEVLNIDGGRGI